MAVTNYFSVNGEIIGEETAGVRVDYLTDALGNVTATVDQTGTVQNTYRHKPYGALLAKTGTAPDPAFTRVGSYGYRQTGLQYGDAYVRARHYSSISGQWTTEDPVYPSLTAYDYAAKNPGVNIDPSGLVVIKAWDNLVKGECGQYHIDFYWQLDNYNTKCSPNRNPRKGPIASSAGWLVQEIVTVESYVPCLTGSPVLGGTQFWEAIRVPANQDTPVPYRWSDISQFSGVPNSVGSNSDRLCQVLLRVCNGRLE